MHKTIRPFLLLSLAAGMLLGTTAAGSLAQTGGVGTGHTAGHNNTGTSGQWRVHSSRFARATWFGPGLWGNRTACGRILRPRTMGVAHKRLRCGTLVVFRRGKRRVRTRVIDRGPFRRGYQWDLTRRAAKRIGMLRQGKARVRATILVRRR